jgi:hypothetical protein
VLLGAQRQEVLQGTSLYLGLINRKPRLSANVLPEDFEDVSAMKDKSKNMTKQKLRRLAGDH